MNVCPLGSYSPMRSAVIPFNIVSRGTTPPIDSVMAHLIQRESPLASRYGDRHTNPQQVVVAYPAGWFSGLLERDAQNHPGVSGHCLADSALWNTSSKGV